MGHCVGVPKTEMKRCEAMKFKSLGRFILK